MLYFGQPPCFCLHKLLEFISLELFSFHCIFYISLQNWYIPQDPGIPWTQTKFAEPFQVLPDDFLHSSTLVIGTKVYWSFLTASAFTFVTNHNLWITFVTISLLHAYASLLWLQRVVVQHFYLSFLCILSSSPKNAPNTYRREPKPHLLHLP